jgi:hypothetical protein
VRLLYVERENIAFVVSAAQLLLLCDSNWSRFIEKCQRAAPKKNYFVDPSDDVVDLLTTAGNGKLVVFVSTKTIN